jgi:alginate O-acetyltransferase complex protein AlgI
MLFNSFTFIVFAGVFFLFLPFVNKLKNPNFRWLYFVIASFFFYGWWDWRYIALIIVNGLIDFFAALLMVNYPTRKKIFLFGSLVTNLGILFSFKYLNFLFDSLNYAGSFAGLHLPKEFSAPAFFVILPVGISFYTFQSMSYTIDVYRDRLSPTKNVLHFFSYLSLFPQLVAGPIVRAKDFLPQLLRVRKATEIERWNGLKLIALGYFKKVVIADNIAPMVNNAFSNDTHIASSIYWWTIMIGFAFQIYCDFSGYSDIARGLSKWMGFHFRVNFNHPYFAISFRNFWQRWHISLSTWFKDYVYIPLGGSKVKKFRSYLNLWITMILSGIWHGAGANFLLWGVAHAFFLTIERITGFHNLFRENTLARCIKIFVIFCLVTMSWVLFRSESLPQVATVLGNMFSMGGPPVFLNLKLPDLFVNGCLFLLLGILMEFMSLGKIGSLKGTLSVAKQARLSHYAEIVQVAVILIMSIFFRGTGEQFIYFQF